VPGGALTPIPGLDGKSARYRPTIDDVGACISVRASLLTPISLGSRSSSLQDHERQQGQQGQQEPPFAAFAEAGPFALPKPTAARLRECLAAQQPMTFKGLREPGTAGPHVHDLVVGPRGVELWSRPLPTLPAPAPAPAPAPTPIVAVAARLPKARPSSPPRQPLKEREPWSSSLSSDDEDGSSGGSSNEGGEEDAGQEGKGELVGRGAYSRETLVALHPLDPTALLVQLPLFLLLSPGSTSPAGPQGREEPGLLLQRTLQAGSSEERELLALLWRAWRRKALHQREAGEGDEGDGAVHDAVLLAAQLKEAGAGEGGQLAIVRVPSEQEGEEPGPGPGLVQSGCLSSSSSRGGSDSGSEEGEGGEGVRAVIRRLQREVSDAREQLAMERQQSQSQQASHRRASSSGTTGGGLGGLLMMRRGSREQGEEQSKEETIRALKREVGALHSRAAELEGALRTAEEEAVREAMSSVARI
jgi:hypothetical protein